MSPLLLLAFFFGGENSLSGYTNPEAYWKGRGVEVDLESMSEFLVEPQHPDEAEIRKWIEGLGAREYADRERASRRLSDIGFPAKSALETARHHSDPEVASRAKKLLNTLKEKAAEQNALDPYMALYSLSQMQDPHAKERIQNVASGAGGELQQQAALFLEPSEERNQEPVENDLFLNAFPEDTCLLLQAVPVKRKSKVVEAVYASPEIQALLVQGLSMFGDVKLNRISMGVTQGEHFLRDSRVVIRLEMDYDPIRLAKALEKIHFTTVQSKPMLSLKNDRVSLFMPDAQNLLVFLTPRTAGEPEISDAQALLKPPDVSRVSPSLIEALPEEGFLRAAMEVSKEAMQDLEEFSLLRRADFTATSNQEELKLKLRFEMEDEESGKRFTQELDSQLAQIREEFNGENGRWIQPMRKALNAVQVHPAGKTCVVEGGLQEEVLVEAVEMVERQLQQIQQFRNQRLNRMQGRNMEFVF